MLDLDTDPKIKSNNEEYVYNTAAAKVFINEELTLLVTKPAEYSLQTQW